jgi:membrane-associated protease RseP (regulator of RpoE activity)
MRLITIVLFVTILLCGCAHNKTTETNYTDVMKIDAMLDDVDGRVIVQSVSPEGPAATAGLSAGDVIVLLDGKSIKYRNEFRRMMYEKQNGDRVLLEVNRNGQLIKIDITPRVQKTSPMILKISGLLDEGKHIKIAVVVGDVTNSLGYKKDWVEALKNNLQSEEESELAIFFKRDRNFSLVGRDNIYPVLEELQINRLELGYVSDQLRIKIAEMTGATHIIEIVFHRFVRPRVWIEDVLNGRLIEAESGSVLAVDQIRTYPTYRW